MKYQKYSLMTISIDLYLKSADKESKRNDGKESDTVLKVYFRATMSDILGHRGARSKYHLVSRYMVRVRVKVGT